MDAILALLRVIILFLANTTVLFPSLTRKESYGINHFMGNGNAYFKIRSTE